MNEGGVVALNGIHYVLVGVDLKQIMRANSSTPEVSVKYVRWASCKRNHSSMRFKTNYYIYIVIITLAYKYPLKCYEIVVRSGQVLLTHGPRPRLPETWLTWLWLSFRERNSVYVSITLSDKSRKKASSREIEEVEGNGRGWDRTISLQVRSKMFHAFSSPVYWRSISFLFFFVIK